MNRREYKKAVTATGTNMCVEIYTIGAINKNADADKIQQAINIVWNAMLRARKGSNLCFGKSERDFENRQAYRKALSAYNKALYSRLDSELETSLDEAVKLVNEALPANS